MHPNESVKRETGYVLIGSVILCAVMLIVFLIIGQMDVKVLLGALCGYVLGCGNFFLMAMNCQKVAENYNPENKEEVNRAQIKLRSSYLTRTLLMLAVLIVIIKTDYVNWITAIIPVVFPTLIMRIVHGYLDAAEKKKKKESSVTEIK